MCFIKRNCNNQLVKNRKAKDEKNEGKGIKKSNTVCERNQSSLSSIANGYFFKSSEEDQCLKYIVLSLPKMRPHNSMFSQKAQKATLHVSKRKTKQKDNFTCETIASLAHLDRF